MAYDPDKHPYDFPAKCVFCGKTIAPEESDAVILAARARRPESPIEAEVACHNACFRAATPPGSYLPGILGRG